jgi:hypothetical protein
MTSREEEALHPVTDLPYLPSWIDLLIKWIENLPGPIWLFYIIAVLVIALIINATFWIDGSVHVGSFDPYNTSYSIFAIYWLVLYHYLTLPGSRALRTFRPLLDLQDDEITRINYELGTLPRRVGWIAIPFGIGIAILEAFGDSASFGELIPQTAIPYVGDFVITAFLASAFLCLLIRSIRQLRMVRKLHTQAANINLLELGPAHAFSDLTARTGIGVILLLILAYTVDPLSFGTASDLLLTIMTVSVAIVIFVVPIMGIQKRIEDEKERTLHRINDSMQIASARLHNQVGSNNYENMGETKDAIEALLQERKLYKEVSTWPWDPKAIRAFASALLLPIFLWLVTRILERLL